LTVRVFYCRCCTCNRQYHWIEIYPLKLLSIFHFGEWRDALCVVLISPNNKDVDVSPQVTFPGKKN